LQNKVLYYTNLNRCNPQSAISKEPERYKWRAIDYETEEIKGTMLMAESENVVPDLFLPLNISGWYKIFLGLYTISDPELRDGIRVKLKDDQTTVFVQAEKGRWLSDSIDEVYWKSSDLTDQDIIFKHQNDGHQKMTSYIAYIKLVKLTDNEVKEIKQERKNNNNKRLIGMNDAHGLYYWKRVDSKTGILEDIEPYRNTDFEKLYWCMGSGGDICTYPTKVGKVYGEDLEIFPRPGDRDIAESMKILRSKDIDSMKTAIEYAKNIGIKIYLSQRMGAFACNPPWDGIFTSDFYKNNPNLRCRDRDGSEVSRLSYAYKEVQDHCISILKELSSYQPDGISLLFNRGAPYILYEEPLVQSFIKEYNKDPRELSEADHKWLNYRAKFFNYFMKKVRRKLDNNLKISVHLFNNEKSNLFYGFDPSTWINKGYIDEIIAYPWRNNDIDINYYINLVKNTNCKLYIDLLPRNMTPNEYRERANDLYKKGVDGLCFWDTNTRHVALRQWSMIRRLGHKEELNNWDDGEGVYFKSIKLKKLGGYRVDRYPPGWAF